MRFDYLIVFTVTDLMKPTQAKMVPPPGAAPGYRNFQFRVSTAITKVANST
jgi:hypothetical protein